MGRAGRPSRFTEAHRAWFVEQDKLGIPRREIARQFTDLTGIPIKEVTLQKMLRKIGVEDAKLANPTRYDLILEADELEVMRELARDFGYVAPMGRRAGDGSISALVGAIARGDLRVQKVPTRSRRTPTLTEAAA